MKKVLVTGGAGCRGSHLVDRLIALDIEVCVLDNLSMNNGRNFNKVGFMEGIWIYDFFGGWWSGYPGNATWGSESGADNTWTYFNDNGNDAYNDVYNDAQQGYGPNLSTVGVGGTDIAQPDPPLGSGDDNNCGPCGPHFDNGEWDFCRREGFRVEFRRINTTTNESHLGQDK